MKNNLNIALSALLISSATGFASSACAFMEAVQPYVGAEAGWRNMGFRRDLGDNLVKKDYFQGNVFLGLKFCDYVGLEAGYEATVNKRKQATILNSDSFFGQVPLAPGASPGLLNTFVTTTRINGWNINLMGYLPISSDNCTSLIGSVGAARLRFSAQNYPTLLSSGIIPVLLPADYTNFVKTKYVARLGVGIQQMVNNCAGVRLMANWENTSRFKRMVAKERDDLHTSLKNSYSLMLGVFYNF